MTYIGIDGCRGGWLFSVLNGNNYLQIKLVAKMQDALQMLSVAQAVSIDMPIGLVEQKGQERTIDLQIRKDLGHPFSSSVFTVPCRKAVFAADYQEANNLNKTIMGKGISIQAWNICHKIKELDIFLEENPTLKSKLTETHPELCFKQLKSSSLQHKKKTKEGFEERIELLETKYPSISKTFNVARKQFLKKDVANDDILDSIVLAINAKSNFYQLA